MDIRLVTVITVEYEVSLSFEKWHPGYLLHWTLLESTVPPLCPFPALPGLDLTLAFVRD